MHWAVRYMCIPFRPYGCGEFVEKVLKEEFGCPYEFPKSASCLRKDPEIIREFLSAKLRETDNPKDGDIVMMDGDRQTCHVGVYVEIKGIHHVLHSERRIRTSCLHRVSDLSRYGYYNARFYTWQK